MNDFLNPYIAGAPVVEPSMFFGRQDVFEWIEQNLSGRFVNHILVIHGQRRVGKTSVLKQIPNHLPSHFIHVFFDLQGRTHTSLDRFQWWMAREICRAVSQAKGESISAPEREQFTQDAEYLAVSFLPEIISRLGESTLIITFDEFDTLSEPEIQQSLAKPLITYLRRMFDLPKLSFIFSIGSSGHKLENMQASYTEFFKTALYRKISFLKHEDCAHLITRPVQGILAYQPAAVQRIYAITSGHPYFTQLVCHELFSLSQKTGRRSLTCEDVDSVLEDVIERGTVNLKFVWDEASDLEKWVLACLAHALQARQLEMRSVGGRIQPACTDMQIAAELHKQHVRYSEEDLNAALVHLREKDVLTQDNHFVVELLSIWLLKNRPLDRVREELVQVNPIANRYNEIGDEFHALGLRDKALDSFRQALATDPSNLRAQVSIANLHMESQDYEHAVQGYEAALRIDDDDVAALSGLCASLMALGEAASTKENFEEAEAYFNRILAVNPDHPEAHLRLARLYSGRAEATLAAGDAELALRYYPRALEHAPDDSHLLESYQAAKRQHIQRLVDELLKQSQQAQRNQDYDAAIDALQRAVQLLPDDPALVMRLTLLKDVARQAKISNLRSQAQEMEASEHWEEAIRAWHACLEMHPQDEAEIRLSLENTLRRQGIARDYNQAEDAIKRGNYKQAISLLQGVIAQDASYKDAAKLLVDCLKARPKREFKLPVRWLRWLLPGILIIAVVAGIISQWTRITPFLASLVPQKTGSISQGTGITPTAIPDVDSTPPPTDVAASPEMSTFTWWVDKLTGNRAPDVTEDFQSATLIEYWANDGAYAGTLHNGVLQQNNEKFIGDGTLQYMNYILQVDLRFTGISSDEAFIYEFRLSPTAEKFSTSYSLKIETSNGNSSLAVNNSPDGQFTHLKGMNLGSFQDGRWYKLGIVVNEQTIAFFLDDKEILIYDSVELFGLMNNFGIVTTSADAKLEIDNWRVWDLGTSAHMRNDWITLAPPTVEYYNFVEGDGWQFNPQGNEKFEDGKAVLFTDNETWFSRNDLKGTNFAIDVSFNSRVISESTSLVVFLGADTATGKMITFDYFPEKGTWAIMRSGGQTFDRILSGNTQPTPADQAGRIMVVMNGDRVSVFYEDTFLGSIITSRPGLGEENFLSLRSKDGSYAQVDITKIGFWDLDMVEWGTDDWITARPETVVIDSFTGNEDLRINPQGDGTYVDGKAVLFTKAGETSLTRNDLHWKNIALEATFIPKMMPDSASLVWVLGKDDTTLDCLEFSYFPTTGEWQINKVVNRQWELLTSGVTQSTPVETGVMINVVAQGNQVSVYLDQGLIGSVEVDRSDASSLNELVLRSRENIYSRVDIERIRSWDLPLVEPVIKEQSSSLSETINLLTGGIPDFMDDFEGTSLHEYWTNDRGAQEATLQDGYLRQNNNYLIGYGSINALNYILWVDLRFNSFSGTDEFVYSIRTTEFDYTTNGTEYVLSIIPGNGDWKFLVMTDPHGEFTVSQSGNLGSLEAGRWYGLGVVVNNDILSVYWDGSLLCSEDGFQLYGIDDHFGLLPISAVNATLDIDNWRYWELGTPVFMRNDWIIESEPTVSFDYFIAGQSWEYSSHEAVRYQDGMLVLFTDGEEQRLFRGEINASNFAMEVSFIPREMTDTASIAFFHDCQELCVGHIMVEYFPTSGLWQMRTTGPGSSLLASGWTQTTPIDNTGKLMILVEGNRVSAFYGDTFLGYAESDSSEGLDRNEVGIRNIEGQYAQADIAEIKLWDLDMPEMMIPERIYLRKPNVEEDNFMPGEDWQFYPVENEKFEEGRAVLYTNGDETHIFRDDLLLGGMKVAMEVTFIPRDMPDPSSLIWFMGVEMNTAGDYFAFEYFPESGAWNIYEIQNNVSNKRGTGKTQTTPTDSIGRIMVIVDDKVVSAFYNGTFIGSATCGFAAPGRGNYPKIRGFDVPFARVDITEIKFWNLDE